MEIGSFITKNYGRTFFHIVYENAEGVDGLFNNKDKNFTLKGSLHWILRIGESKHNEQIFIQNFDSKELIEGDSNGHAQKIIFLEQYFPIKEGIYFNILCMNVFLKILSIREKENKILNSYEFSEIIREEKEKLENEYQN